MGKHKKKRRESSYSSSKRSHSRSRSKNRRKSSDDSIRISSSHRQSLLSTKHFTYLCNQTKSIGVPYVVWNLCSKLVPRPRSTLIICENMSQVAAVCQANNLNRTLKPIDESQREIDLKKIVEKEQIEVVIMSQKKCSILLALEDYQKLFDLIICTAKNIDVQFYLKMNEILNLESILVTFSETIQSIKKLSQSLGVQIEEISAQLTESQRNRQLKSDIQYAPKPSNDTYVFLHSFPFSTQQIAARFIELDRIRRQPPKSLHLGMPGYVTYRLDMDVEFNSLKYVWNFLREEFPKILYESLKGMQKYSNDKGVVFNIPCEMKYLIQIVVQKLKRNRLKLKGIELQQCAVLPPLQDADSEQSRLLREKKQLALENKSELEIFIGGVPYEMDQNSLRLFFKDHEVNLFLVRILKDEKGFSKGIGFGLCQNKDHFERAIRLNGSKLLDRTIRVKRADQRKD